MLQKIYLNHRQDPNRFNHAGSELSWEVWQKDDESPELEPWARSYKNKQLLSLQINFLHATNVVTDVGNGS